MKNKNTIIITEEMINSDPYGYTYKEICDCVGEKKARSLMHALYNVTFDSFCTINALAPKFSA